MTKPILDPPPHPAPLQLADAERAQVLSPHWETFAILTKQVPLPYSGDGAYVYYRDVALARDSARPAVALDPETQNVPRESHRVHCTHAW